MATLLSETRAVAQNCYPRDPYLALSDDAARARCAVARKKLGGSAVILGHHYQRDEVIEFADYTGDSYKLAKAAAASAADFLVFCGVHFMAESADILSQPGQQVVLPDLNAGCSMADMAEIGQVEMAWEQIARAGVAGIVPVTYINSTAAIKAFCGRHGGLVCTSSNAHAALEWALQRGEKALFLPDQHLGRNTAYAMGIPLDACVVWDPYSINGGLTGEQLRRARVVLWKGHCSVHQRFLPEHVAQMRRAYPDMRVLAHPECRWEVCQQADGMGSTEALIRMIDQAPEGTRFAVGTEMHLVGRLARKYAAQGKQVLSLDSHGCLCTTMYRISPQHLCWALENLAAGNVVNRIQVDVATKHWARVALDRMLELSPAREAAAA